MKPKKSYFIISYDIANKKRLAKIARYSEKYLNRVLYSVFEGELTDVQFAQLKSEVDKVLVLDEDSVFFIKLCAECVENIHIQGSKVPLQKDKNFWIS